MDLRCNSLELGVCTVQAIFAGKFHEWVLDRKSTRLNSSQITISYAVFCLKKKTKKMNTLCASMNMRLRQQPPNTSNLTSARSLPTCTTLNQLLTIVSSSICRAANQKHS